MSESPAYAFQGAGFRVLGFRILLGGPGGPGLGFRRRELRAEGLSALLKGVQDADK